MREMNSEKKDAHVWVRQNAVKISISVNVWENKKQLIFTLLSSLFRFAPPFCKGSKARKESVVNII